ncbi:bifunctional DNA-formamidopyrimidine glycosylase/DNA-(apurinic or apyrimidinic site) lyase [Agarilytica rhodophyticola]|uniref:bifunctional DNA-formamidopyrimidine glycosylase/DNA-(apurinic or apyrimidinic site) lyase n=1 Tax=Agarilytica rhodophyticola TaxID=1737490 RepID=UPI000B342AFC|nr:bifunctional DNA-formamidopyrimidine glycosylase/DNA-(apurinic or apyrimidinic site) lyase [Agarilytica rhodophyticola]
MPELPEVETTCRGIAPHIEQQSVKKVTIRNASLRWPVDEKLPKILRNKTLNHISRRGKYLLLHFDHGAVLWHLGMSGSLRIIKENEKPKLHDHVDVQFNNGNILRFHDPRRFGSVIWTEESLEEHKLLHHLGPEPLSDNFHDDYLYERSRKIQQAVKTWIMDSKVVVGVGNIYANEALFKAGIHPLKSASKISRPKYKRLTEEIKSILHYAIQRGGTTLRDFVGGDGKPGYFAQELNVYGRGGEPCVTCKKPLTEKRLGQRSTVYCTHCQK